MQHLLKKFKGTKVVSVQGEDLGTVSDFYFDDERWVIRYFVVEAGHWYHRTTYLLSPLLIEGTILESQITARLSRVEIRNCPTPDDEQPISRLYEEKYASYYQIPIDWSFGEAAWTSGVYPVVENDELDRVIATSHMRSYDEILGYSIHATDGIFGKVKDLVVDDDTYAITDVVLDTGGLFGQLFLIHPEWIKSISWAGREFMTSLDKSTLKQSPEWPSAELS